MEAHEQQTAEIADPSMEVGALSAQETASTPESAATTELIAEATTTAQRDRFSPETRQVLASATELARNFGNAEIRPVHLLVALLLDQSGTAIRPLLRFAGGKAGDLVSLRETLVQRLQQIGPADESRELILSDGCKQVIQIALTEVGRLNRPQLEPAHLLYGLVAEGSALTGSAIPTSLALRGLGMVMGVGPWGLRRGLGNPSIHAGQLLTPNLLPNPGPAAGAPPATRNHVITFRVTDAELAAVDVLVEAGAMRTRSEASSWLLQSGIAANQSFFDQIRQIGEEITRLRQEVQRLADEHIGRTTTTTTIEAAPSDAPPNRPASRLTSP